MQPVTLRTLEEEKPARRQENILPETSIEAALKAFRPISLAEMDEVALMSRMDSKFLFSANQLLVALRNLRYRYQVLTISGQRIHHYRTLYFDTPGFEMYHQHVTGRADVYKVREREYVDTRISFLEIKHKNRKNRTEKSRMPINAQGESLDPRMMNFLGARLPLDGQPLEPKLWNTFNRITLVSISGKERLTIDLDLAFTNMVHGVSLDGIVIAEVKQEAYCNRSAFIEEMRGLGIRQTGMSKYCFGVSQLYDSVKKNTQKERLLMIEKIQQKGFANVCYA